LRGLAALKFRDYICRDSPLRNQEIIIMSNTNINTVRTVLSKLGQTIENLAREVQTKLNQGADPLAVANELVRNSSTFVFTLGEMYALEQQSNGKKVKATVVASGSSSTSNTGSRNYHNLRDASGRFRRV
jgi:hypothetical protein